jgi:C4-dicarboxylate-specific signal transduction histidine kinase
MSSERDPVMGEERVGEDQLRFMAEITASVTHEMRNVLATIRESAGLVGDLVEMVPEGSFPKKERVQRALKSIDEQVERGVELAGKLNRFAHSIDERWAQVNLEEVVEEICLLLSRKARNRRVNLVPVYVGQGGWVKADPFYLRFIICYCLDYCLEGMEAGGSVEIRLQALEKGLTLKISSTRSSGGVEGPQAQRRELAVESLASSCGIEVLRGEGQGERWVELSFKD